MKIGKLYKHKETGVVVECTTPVNDGFFGGSVVNSDNMYNIGDYFGHWVCNSFEEYESIQTLVSGSSYIIPKDCKAEIKDGVVTIKDTIEHFKIQPLIPSIYTLYIRKYPDRQINVYIFDSGHASISHNKIDAGDKCTEQEFMEAYNKALKKIKL